MSGIDTSAAALQVSRLAGLAPVGGAGASAGTAQTGVSALTGGAANLPDAAAAPTAQASTQTVLSGLALALDAIVRSGGDATAAVVGAAPLWADPDAAAAAARGSADAVVMDVLDALADAVADGADTAMLPGAGAQAADGGTAAGASAADGAADAGGMADARATNGAGAAAPTAAARGGDPVSALAVSLQRTVSGSGLFYESHLAQWLLGQRSPAELAAEPQNRLVASAAAPLPPDWRRGAGDAADVFWTDPQAGGAQAPNPADPAQATLFDDGLLDVLFPSGGADANATAQAANPTNATNPQGQSLAVHPALIPLLRQQLDVLATGEFRWAGDAWPGARLDWSVRQDGDDARRGARAADADGAPWRTRLTLSLPSLGIVDAELTLAGATLAVRVQASNEGATRLAAHGEALRGRMAAAGIELAGLSIREVGGAAPGSGGAQAARAANAYARAAAAGGATAAPASAPAPSAGSPDEAPR